LPQTNQDTKVGHIDAIMLTVGIGKLVCWCWFVCFVGKLG